MKLAKYLVTRDILDENDPDYNYLKQFAKSEDKLDYSIPRNNFSQKVKDATRKRQGNKCAFFGCRSRDFFEFDHIKGRDDNSFSNCQMLCLFHHQLKTNEDAIKAKIEKNLNDGKSLDEINFKSRTSSYPRSRNNTTRKHEQRRTFKKSNTRRVRR